MEINDNLFTPSILIMSNLQSENTLDQDAYVTYRVSLILYLYTHVT